VKTKMKKHPKKAAATDSMAAARAARVAKGKKTTKKTTRAPRDAELPDFKKLRARHLKFKEENGVGIVKQSGLVSYFRALGLRSPKEDIVNAAVEELYGLLLRAARRTTLNNRKTVRGFDIR
jgi:hypothetical protein